MNYFLYDDFYRAEQGFNFFMVIFWLFFIGIIIAIIMRSISQKSNNNRASSEGAIMLVADSAFDGIGLILSVAGNEARIKPVYLEKTDTAYLSLLANGIEYEYTTHSNSNGTMNTSRDHLLKNFKVYYSPSEQTSIVKLSNCARFDEQGFYGAFIKDIDKLKRIS